MINRVRTEIFYREDIASVLNGIEFAMLAASPGERSDSYTDGVLSAINAIRSSFGIKNNSSFDQVVVLNEIRALEDSAGRG